MEASRDPLAAEHALSELLSSRELRGYRLSRHCELGPYLIDYLFAEQSLIVELTAEPLEPESPASARHLARVKFLRDLGYEIWGVSRREVLRHPERALGKLLSVLKE